MVCPSLTLWFVQSQSVQTAAGVGRFHHRVHVIASLMGRQQTPYRIATNLSR
jgi:hypothetical protein